uniref:Uncharacterized protein n=1 Tax=Manihot esculenta TaxID=3983 RepID=A0A199UBG5_MANES
MIIFYENVYLFITSHIFPSILKSLAILCFFGYPKIFCYFGNHY